MKRLHLPTGSLVMVSVTLTVLRQQTRQRCGAMLQWFRRGLPVAVEAIMLMGSARLAFTLLSNQDYFERFPGPYDWIVAHGAPYSFEWVWGMAAGVAALMKAVGLCLCLAYRRDPVMQDLGYGVRLLGWLASVFVWGAFSLSFSIWDPLALTSITSSFAFALAFWGLFMGPAMPDDDVG